MFTDYLDSVSGL